VASGDDETSGSDGFHGVIAVYEVSDSARRSARKVVQSLGYRLAVESSPEAIERRAQSDAPPDLLIVSLPEGQALVDALRAAPRPPIVVASLAGPPATARERFTTIDAELYSVRPHSAESLGPVVHAAGVLAHRDQRIRALRGAEDRLREQLHEVGYSGRVTGFQHFEFFKRLLVLEIKRAKRYGYSIAVCLVAPDPFERPEPGPAVVKKLVQKAATAITSCIRDIDIPVDYAEDRMLLFLPFTDAKGAKEVGERVGKEVAKQAHTRDGDRLVRMTVSVGVSALKEGKEISFARLMKDANAALKAAQLKGGRRVIVRA
jgi:diguanylate cyclase (GGDEF)-like protein